MTNREAIMSQAAKHYHLFETALGFCAIAWSDASSTISFSAGPASARNWPIAAARRRLFEKPNFSKPEMSAGTHKLASASGQTVLIAAVSAAAPSCGSGADGTIAGGGGIGTGGGGAFGAARRAPGITTDIVFSMKSAPT